VEKSVVCFLYFDAEKLPGECSRICSVWELATLLEVMSWAVNEELVDEVNG